MKEDEVSEPRGDNQPIIIVSADEEIISGEVVNEEIIYEQNNKE